MKIHTICKHHFVFFLPSCPYKISQNFTLYSKFSEKYRQFVQQCHFYSKKKPTLCIKHDLLFCLYACIFLGSICILSIWCCNVAHQCSRDSMMVQGCAIVAVSTTIMSPKLFSERTYLRRFACWGFPSINHTPSWPASVNT